MEAGADGSLVDKTRPSRIPQLSDALTERVVPLTLTSPPGEVTHWTAAAVAAACGISVSSVHRIWRRHGLTRAPVDGYARSRCEPFFIIQQLHRVWKETT
jgi:hypothetical protein